MAKKKYKNEKTTECCGGHFVFVTIKGKKTAACGICTAEVHDEYCKKEILRHNKSLE